MQLIAWLRSGCMHSFLESRRPQGPVGEPNRMWGQKRLSSAYAVLLDLLKRRKPPWSNQSSLTWGMKSCIKPFALTLIGKISTEPETLPTSLISWCIMLIENPTLATLSAQGRFGLATSGTGTKQEWFENLKSPGKSLHAGILPVCITKQICNMGISLSYEMNTTLQESIQQLCTHSQTTSLEFMSPTQWAQGVMPTEMERNRVFKHLRFTVSLLKTSKCSATTTPYPWWASALLHFGGKYT